MVIEINETYFNILSKDKSLVIGVWYYDENVTKEDAELAKALLENTPAKQSNKLDLATIESLQLIAAKVIKESK